MYIAMVAPLNTRIVNLSGALYANHGSKIDLQELASNEHICSVEGHVVTIESKGSASEDRITYEGGILLAIDATELLSLDTKRSKSDTSNIAPSASRTNRTSPHLCDLHFGLSRS